MEMKVSAVAEACANAGGDSVANDEMTGRKET